MPMVKWDPFRNMATLQDRINRLFDDAFPRTHGGEDLSLSDWHPLVDIYEIEEGMALQIDLPGVDKKDISVEVKDNTLTIQGERRSDNSVKEDHYYRRERPVGTFHRSFVMPTAVDPEAIKATFNNGVLKIQIPKPKLEKPAQVSVDIE